MNKFPYQVAVCWSDEDKAWQARIPAFKNCIAYGETPQEAVTEIMEAAQGWMETAEKYGFPIPKPSASLERLTSLADLLNISALAREAGIPAQTLASKLKRRTPLNEAESQRITEALQSRGLVPA